MTPAPPFDGFIYEVFPEVFSEGGDLAGVTEQLPRLVELGVGAVLLMPIHPIGHLGRRGPQGNPWSVRDHFELHPALGVMDDLRALAARAHELGLKLLLDFVCDRCAPDGVVALEHPDWLLPGELEGVLSGESEVLDQVRFDPSHPQLRRYLAEILQHWLREAGVDGFRCHQAARLPPDLWLELRAVAQQVRPDAILLGDDPAAAALGAFDVFIDHDFFLAVRGLRRFGSPPPDLWRSRERLLEQLPPGTPRVIFLESHFWSRAGDMGAISQQAPLVLQYCYDATPMLYAGQEIGICDTPWLDQEDVRKPIRWSWDDVVISRLHSNLGELRRRRPSLTRGSLVPLDSGHPEVIAFERRLGDERTIVIANLSGAHAVTELQRRSSYSCESIGAPMGFPEETEQGLVMGAHGWLVYGVEG